MRTIFKYPIAMLERTTLHIPKGAKLLCVAEQNGAWFLWAEIDTSKLPTKREIVIVGTGQPMLKDAAMWYIGTIHTSGGYVWHVFEELPE